MQKIVIEADNRHIHKKNLGLRVRVTASEDELDRDWLENSIANAIMVYAEQIVLDLKKVTDANIHEVVTDDQRAGGTQKVMFKNGKQLIAEVKSKLPEMKLIEDNDDNKGA